MTGKRKTHTAKFKAEVALAALKGDRTVNELATQYGVHPTLIHSWKKLLATGAEGVFGTAARVPDPTPDQSPALFELWWTPKTGPPIKLFVGRSIERGNHDG